MATFGTWIQQQTFDHLTATAIYALYTKATGEKSPSTKIGRPIIAEYCSSTNNHGTTHWTTKPVEQPEPKPAKVDAKTLARSVVFRLFDDRGYWDMVDLMTGEDQDTSIEDFADYAKHEVMDAFDESGIDKPVKMYRSKLIKYYNDWKGPAYDALINSKRTRLLARFGIAGIKRYIHYIETSHPTTLSRFDRQDIVDYMSCEWDFEIPELDTYRDEAHRREAVIQDAINEMRIEYHAEEKRLELERIRDGERRKVEMADLRARSGIVE
jgi:hypothetical protein